MSIRICIITTRRLAVLRQAQALCMQIAVLMGLPIHAADAPRCRLAFVPAGSVQYQLPRSDA